MYLQEPCILSKEPCILSKEPCILSKEPCILSKEPCDEPCDVPKRRALSATIFGYIAGLFSTERGKRDLEN